ncbi:LysR family transcriptional regulator [Microbacterium kyungheense]|uniref:DNA-binding transcriptional LysR family regulator n=1 Tax=Microbacterium kyungheense TaxID=1263636 RepID=A0A543EF69_9MICO|nr:LysR family transcriptional regulator [Microbacterium kyungheense]TQM20235.1 DNA-binding transcriptional LysR family regulator [Microbacterium kyungheense]
MQELDLLHTFLEVHRAGSITAAAARLGVSQPAVSERIARLESELGVALLVRSARGVTPTEAGDALAARVSEPVDRLRDVWAAPVAVPAEPVRIGGASDVTAARIIPALAPLAQADVRIVFTLGLAHDLLRLLVAGELDVVVSSVRAPMRGIRYRGLVDEEFVLVGAPAAARSIDPVRFAADPAAALQHLSLVAYDADLSIVRRYWRSRFGHRPSNPVSMVVPDLRGVLAAVVAGAGISALPRYLAQPAVDAGAVVVLHRPEEATINTLHLAIRTGEPPSSGAARVIDALVDRAREWDVF